MSPPSLFPDVLWLLGRRGRRATDSRLRPGPDGLCRHGPDDIPVVVPGNHLGPLPCPVPVLNDGGEPPAPVAGEGRGRGGGLHSTTVLGLLRLEPDLT